MSIQIQKRQFIHQKGIQRLKKKVRTGRKCTYIYENSGDNSQFNHYLNELEYNIDKLKQTFPRFKVLYLKTILEQLENDLEMAIQILKKQAEQNQKQTTKIIPQYSPKIIYPQNKNTQETFQNKTANQLAKYYSELIFHNFTCQSQPQGKESLQHFLKNLFQSSTEKDKQLDKLKEQKHILINAFSKVYKKVNIKQKELFQKEKVIEQLLKEYRRVNNQKNYYKSLFLFNSGEKKKLQLDRNII